MKQFLALAKALKSKNLSPADYQRRKPTTKERTFLLAYAYYLLSLINNNTRENYKTTIQHFARFMASSRRATPLDATGIDVTLWREDLMRTGGVAGARPYDNLDRYAPHENSSVSHKVDVLSAFFKFLQKPGLNGSPPLMTDNPVNSLQSRFKIEKYGNSKKISLEAFKGILGQIDKSTIKGLRDYVLIYGYFITGRRNSEWVKLQWKNLNFNTDPPTYTVLRKGQKQTTDELPEGLQIALLAYMQRRWGEDFLKRIDNETYLFTAMPGRGGARQIINPNNPLTERSMLRIVKNYAKDAGLDETKITVHSLRHLHAESYLKAGASVEEVRARLRHQNLATTQRYVSSMADEKNRLADILDKMILD